jgi:flagellar biosynthesis/type III secretory pathway M-ring protein FliF/YscJ
MNELLRSLADGLKNSSLASKLTAGLVALALLLIVGFSALITGRPHFSVLLSQLDDNEAATAMKALAEAGIPFEASQPPGPFVVYVDEDDRKAALAAIYQAGAMIPLQRGIPADEGGMASVFMSSGERQQISQKRLWGEMEGILESLDFVAQARVQTSTSTASPFSLAPVERTAAVQLQLKSAAALTSAQAQTVVMLVSSGLEVPPESIVLSDQTGRLLNGAETADEEDQPREDWIEHKERYDANLAAKANGALGDILGPLKARVEVDSQWSFEQSTTSSETVSKGTVVSETKNSSETPLELPATSAEPAQVDVGTATEAAASADKTAAVAVPAVSTTSEQRMEYDPSRSRKETVNNAPTLQRLSVALFLDESIPTESVRDLEDAVKAAVGFDGEQRTDTIKTVRLAFARPPEPAEGEASADGAEAAPEEVAEEPSPMVRMLMRRGVEVLTAVVFIALLLSSLRSAKKGAVVQAAAASGEDDELDPELLAQTQVKELLTSDPKRVSEILTQWAREAEKAEATR